MIDKVIAKFYVQTVEQQGGKNHETGKPEVTGIKVNLAPVYDPDGKDSENNKFFRYTPAGQLWMQINNPATFDFFRPGEEIYLTFSKNPT